MCAVFDRSENGPVDTISLDPCVIYNSLNNTFHQVLYFLYGISYTDPKSECPF